MRVLRAVPVDDPRVSRGRTLPQLLRDRARDSGASPAIRSKRAGVWRTLAWSEVNRRVRQYAAGLAAAGLKRGEVIAFVTENCEEQFMLQIAALSIGARVVCSYPDASVDELRFLLGTFRRGDAGRAGPGAGRQGAGDAARRHAAAGDLLHRRWRALEL